MPLSRGASVKKHVGPVGLGFRVENGKSFSGTYTFLQDQLANLTSSKFS